MEQEHLKNPTEDKKRIQNLWALIILLAGLFAGSLFIDLVQLATGSGFSRHVVASHDVLVANGKTWVAYQEPKVRLQLVTDAACQTCSGTEALAWLRRIVPTMEVETVDIKGPAGEKLSAKFQFASLPAFVFSKEITETEFYSQAEALFRENDRQFVFDMAQIGLPAGKYLSAPAITDEDILIGNRDAKAKVLVYTDFECEYCKEFHQELMQASREFGDDVALVFRHLPLSFHARAPDAALAAQCAAKQGKFPEYADRLFGNQSEWAEQAGNSWFVATARSLRLDTRQFQSCLTDPKTEEKLRADEASADEYGITGTPSTFVNGTFLSGAVGYDILEKSIRDELDQR